MHKRPLIAFLGLTALTAIGVMAMSVSPALASLLLLLNGGAASLINGTLTVLATSLKAENGLKVKCTGGTGTAKLTQGLGITVSAEGTLEGCVWVGAEEKCTIADGGGGKIKVKGSGQLTMVGSNVHAEGTSSGFATILTEGALCTIPKKEVISGTFKCKVLEPLAKATMQSCGLEVGNLKLGSSKVTELTGEAHIKDENPSATVGVSLPPWSLLLNGASVTSMTATLTALQGLLEAENGLSIKCSGGTGTSSFKLTEDKQVVGSASATLEGCVWEGAEKVCTINDGGAGRIKIQATGELIMVGETVYIVSTSSQFTTLMTEGAFCSIPEEEVISGTLKCRILEPLKDATVHTCHREPGILKLGASLVKKFEGEVHFKDADPNATFAFHLVG